MAKPRLFPEQPQPQDDKSNEPDRFTALASKVMQVAKSEIDKREQEWREQQDQLRNKERTV